MPEARGWGKWEDVGQMVLTSIYQLNKFWGYNVSMVTAVNSTIAQECLSGLVVCQILGFGSGCVLMVVRLNFTSGSQLTAK